MKLRDRTRRVLGNIKQEDCKPVLTTADSSTVTVPDTNTIDLTIKQEDTKEDKTLLKQDGGFNEKDYYYRCDICDMKMANLKLVLEHRASIHINKRYSKPKIKNIDTEPDVHDSDLYCKSCERRYIDRKKYRHHLRQVHYMVLKPLPIWKAPRSDVFPDPDDPKLHCRACDRSYKHKQIYNAHCRYAHGMKSIKLAKQSSESSSTTDTYCQTCDRRLSSMCSYRLHLFAVHKVNWKTIQRKREDMPLPNVNDPNYYCRSCEKKMTSKSNFNCHLMLVHSIFQTAPRKKSRLNPDVNDPNNYCRVCRKTYPSRGRTTRSIQPRFLLLRMQENLRIITRLQKTL
ncbi:hypothetical protein MBANPS3_001738 [Mucor bainieri]